MSHELVQALERVRLPPCRTLREMLNECPQHRTERRGCGLTQATRFLADYINRPRDPLGTADLAMFDEWPTRTLFGVASRALDQGWRSGWRDLADAPSTVADSLTGMSGAEDLSTLRPRLARVRDELRFPESRSVLDLMADILSSRRSSLPQLPHMAEKPQIGSCSQAEEFFLEIAHGKIRRGGQVNIFVGETMQPILVEKMGLGESHSAMLVSPAQLCGVSLPPGGLTALRYKDDVSQLGQHRHGCVFPISALAEVRFLRLTTLTVEPEHRDRAFGDQFRRQVQSNMLSPGSTRIEDLARFADRCVGRS